MFYLQKIRYALKTPWQRTLYIMFVAQLMTAIGLSSIFPFFPLYVNQLGSRFWQALVGVAAGGIVPSISALQARFTRHGLEGTVYGLDNSIGSGARSLAPMIGSGIAVWWSLRTAFPITSLILILASVTTSLFLPRKTAEAARQA